MLHILYVICIYTFEQNVKEKEKIVPNFYNACLSRYITNMGGGKALFGFTGLSCHTLLM